MKQPEADLGSPVAQNLFHLEKRARDLGVIKKPRVSYKGANGQPNASHVILAKDEAGRGCTHAEVPVSDKPVLVALTSGLANGHADQTLTEGTPIVNVQYGLKTANTRRVGRSAEPMPGIGLQIEKMTSASGVKVTVATEGGKMQQVSTRAEEKGGKYAETPVDVVTLFDSDAEGRRVHLIGARGEDYGFIRMDVLGGLEVTFSAAEGVK